MLLTYTPPPFAHKLRARFSPKATALSLGARQMQKNDVDTHAPSSFYRN